MKFVTKKNLSGIFFLALTIRLSFSFWLSKYYFGKVTFTFGDSFSYTESIKNLIYFDKFTFDVNTPDAYLYRGPVYPIFWGIHYLIFGDDTAYIAVAVTQCIIDAVSAILIYLLAFKLTNHNMLSLLCGLTYTIFPTFIVYVPITGTETFATFLTLLTFIVLVNARSNRDYLILGVLCGLATMTRQYLGLLVVLSVVFIFISGITQNRTRWRIASLIIVLGFALCVLPLFARNWINHDTPTILMGQTTGYKVAQADGIAWHKFYSLFIGDVTSPATSIARYGRDGIVDREILGWQQKEIDRLGDLAMRCGPSFRYVRQWFPEHRHPFSDDKTDCTKELVEGYTSLRAKYLERYGIRLWMTVPLRNIAKAIFKGQLTKSLTIQKDRITGLIFKIRSLFVILGLCSVFFFKRKEYLALLIFPLGLIFYTSVITRHVEIRYLVQADALLLGLATVTICGLISRKRTLPAGSAINLNG